MPPSRKWDLCWDLRWDFPASYGMLTMGGRLDHATSIKPVWRAQNRLFRPGAAMIMHAFTLSSHGAKSAPRSVSSCLAGPLFPQPYAPSSQLYQTHPRTSSDRHPWIASSLVRIAGAAVFDILARGRSRTHRGDKAIGLFRLTVSQQWYNTAIIPRAFLVVPRSLRGIND